jgi:hypothetical protein
MRLWRGCPLSGEWRFWGFYQWLGYVSKRIEMIWCYHFNAFWYSKLTCLLSTGGHRRPWCNFIEVILFRFSLPFLEQNSAHSQVVFLFG